MKGIRATRYNGFRGKKSEAPTTRTHAPTPLYRVQLLSAYLAPTQQPIRPEGGWVGYGDILCFIHIHGTYRMRDNDSLLKWQF